MLKPGPVSAKLCLDHTASRIAPQRYRSVPKRPSIRTPWKSRHAEHYWRDAHRYADAELATLICLCS